MKLRNLMYATMIACAFASCSKDDVTTPDGGANGEAAEASLSVKVNVLQTKVANTTDITTLDVLVFKGAISEAPVIEAIGHATGNTEALDIPVSAGNKTVLVLANAPTGVVSKTNIPNYAALAALAKNFANESGAGFTMNSKAYEVNVRVGEVNCLGYSSAEVTAKNGVAVTAATGVDVATPVKLYRNVAKVVLTGITNTPKAGYPSGTYTFKGVFLLHGNKATRLVGTGSKEWGSTEVIASLNYLNGYLTTDGTKDTYAAWKTAMADKTPVYQFLTGSNYAEETSYIATTAPTTAAPTTFYAYENTNTTTKTLLVVKADYSYTGISGTTITESNRYYPVAVGFSGIDADKGVIGSIATSNADMTAAALVSGRVVGDAKVFGVLRNIQYNIALTISGPGYETPFGPKPDGGGDGDGDTFLDVKCKIVEFGQVNQDVDVE